VGGQTAERTDRRTYEACRIVVFAVAATGAVAALPGWNFRAAAASSPSPLKLRVVEAYGRIPMQFEANRGQTDEQVKFLSRGGGYTMFLTRSEAVLVLAVPLDAQQNVSSFSTLRAFPTSKLDTGDQPFFAWSCSVRTGTPS
jgi:hypothetical protein